MGSGDLFYHLFSVYPVMFLPEHWFGGVFFRLPSAEYYLSLKE
jgi:hypothetical protein